jgi:hypothetical protein
LALGVGITGCLAEPFSSICCLPLSSLLSFGVGYPWQPMLADQIIADSGAVAGVIAIVGAGVGAC